jgi:hypothetical protein
LGYPAANYNRSRVNNLDVHPETGLMVSANMGVDHGNIGYQWPEAGDLNDDGRTPGAREVRLVWLSFPFVVSIQ